MSDLARSAERILGAMFSNVGWGELLILGIVALVVLGPERLPEAVRWITGAIRKVKEFANTAQQQLKDDFGTDLEEFREPLSQLNELRGMSPRALVTKHLLDGDDAILTGRFDQAAPTPPAAQAAMSQGGAGTAYPSSSELSAEPGPGAPAARPSGPVVWDIDAT